MDRRKLVYAIMLIGTGLSYWFLWLGVSNIVSSVIIYGLFFFLLHVFLRREIGMRFSTNGRVLFLSVCLSVMILELGLRIVTEKYQTHSERRGSFWYQCPFTSIRLETFARSFTDEDVRLHVSQKSVTLTDENSEFAYAHTFNSFGFRDEEIELSNINSEFVIAGFGDSFTEGVGTHQDSTWVKLLEGDLKSCMYKLRTVNVGSSASDIIYEAYKFKHLVAKTHKPELAVFAINTTDINDLIIRGGFERFVARDRIEYRHGPWWKYLYSFSYVWRVFAHEIIGVEWTLYTKETYKKLEEEANNLICSTIIDEIIPFAKDHNIQTLFVLTPYEHELDEDSFAFTDLSADLEQSGVNVLNLHKEFAKFSKQGQNYYWKIDMHCNSQGYLVWSKAIAATIMEKELINCDN